MPEGPELHLASRFINHACKGRIFGKIFKSEISKNPVVHPPADRYTITASSRGKEIKVTLKEATDSDKQSKEKVLNTQPKALDILFTFGLAGKFDFHEADELQKHAHLNFFTCDSGPDMVLSFVDYMRFGKWSPGVDFSMKDRGPCVLFDYNNFRENVFKNLAASAFNKPICEVLLNQKYFNGIGNYLRAEILHRAKIPPFVSARSVLEPLAEDEGKVKSEIPDILQLCHILPHEVIALESSWYDGKDRSDESNTFNAWLQCYYQDGMNNIADHNKRTVWYSGPLGPLAPKEGKVRARKTTKSKKKSSESEGETDQSNKKSVRKRKQKAEIQEDVEPSENKKAKRSRSAKSTKSKIVKEEKIEIKVEIVEDIDQVKSKGKNKKSVKQKKNISRSGDLTETMKASVQTGRLTRGKIKEIVETIENISESKPKIESKASKKKKSAGGKEKVNFKSEKKEITDKTENGEAHDVLGAVKTEHDSAVSASEYTVKVEESNGVEIEANESLVLSARTKSRARAGRALTNGAAYLQSSKSTQREKLKTPRKRRLRRLSTN